MEYFVTRTVSVSKTKWNEKIHKPLLVQCAKNDINIAESMYFSSLSLSKELTNIKHENEKLEKMKGQANEEKMTLKRKLKIKENEKLESDKNTKI